MFFLKKKDLKKLKLPEYQEYSSFDIPSKDKLLVAASYMQKNNFLDNFESAKESVIKKINTLIADLEVVMSDVEDINNLPKEKFLYLERLDLSEENLRYRKEAIDKIDEDISRYQQDLEALKQVTNSNDLKFKINNDIVLFMLICDWVLLTQNELKEREAKL